MPGPGVDPLYDVYVKAFGSLTRERPPRHYLDVLIVYAGDAELFVSKFDSGTSRFETSWLDGNVIGTLSVTGAGDDAKIAGNVRPLATVSEVELGAVTSDDGLKLVGMPSITVRFADGSQAEVGPGDHNGLEFIAEVLSRVKSI